jgi:hypothetical protein
VERCASYCEIIAWDRGWLAPLPADLARRIALDNAVGLFDGQLRP